MSNDASPPQSKPEDTSSRDCSGLKNGVIFTVVGVCAYLGSLYLINALQPEPLPAQTLFNPQDAHAKSSLTSPDNDKVNAVVENPGPAPTPPLIRAKPTKPSDKSLTEQFEQLNKLIETGEYKQVATIRDQIVKQHPETKAQLRFVDEFLK